MTAVGAQWPSGPLQGPITTCREERLVNQLAADFGNVKTVSRRFEFERDSAGSI